MEGNNEDNSDSSQNTRYEESSFTFRITDSDQDTNSVLIEDVKRVDINSTHTNFAFMIKNHKM